MNGRKGLTLVTALTVASLLIGAGALNALAEGHGGGSHGGGQQAKPEHQQQQAPDLVNQAKHDGESHAGQQANPQGTAVQDDREGHHDNDQINVKQKDADDNIKVEREDNDDEDLVTPPARVTDEDRPGLGCGDDNHIHTGAPGNPDKTCKGPDDADDDDSASTAVTVAGAVSQADAVSDDRDGD